MRSVVLLAVVAAFAVACAPAPLPEGATARAVVVVPDTTGLTYLVAPEAYATTRQRAARQALIDAMERAQYRVVTDPRDRYDVEIVARVEVTGSELDADGGGNGARVGTTERLHCSIRAVAHGTVLATATADFVSKDGAIAPSDLTPAVNVLGGSSRLTGFAASVRRVAARG